MGKNTVYPKVRVGRK